MCNIVDPNFPDEESCASAFLRSVLLSDDLNVRTRCLENNQGLFAIKCMDCCAPFEFEQLYAYLPPQARDQWSTLIAINSIDQKNEMVVFCPLPNCNKPVIVGLLNCKIEYFNIQCLYCNSNTCATCRRVITDENSAVLHQTTCWSLLDLKQDIENAIELGLNMQCPNPQCNKRARKDMNCTHVSCSYCKLSYCFLCQRPRSEWNCGGN